MSTTPYSLDNAEEINAQSPESFPIPPREMREALAAGDYAKVIFRGTSADGGAQVERMWVEVRSYGNRDYVGTLANDPFDLAGLAHGDEIRFGPEHVIAISQA